MEDLHGDAAQRAGGHRLRGGKCGDHPAQPRSVAKECSVASATCHASDGRPHHQPPETKGSVELGQDGTSSSFPFRLLDDGSPRWRIPVSLKLDDLDEDAAQWAGGHHLRRGERGDHYYQPKSLAEESTEVIATWTSLPKPPHERIHVEIGSGQAPPHENQEDPQIPQDSAGWLLHDE